MEMIKTFLSAPKQGVGVVQSLLHIPVHAEGRHQEQIVFQLLCRKAFCGFQLDIRRKYGIMLIFMQR